VPSRKIVGAIKRLYPKKPVVIQASQREVERWANLMDGSRVLPTPVTRRALLGSVEGVLAHRN
jgi:putative N-acetylmannosamine-6-phosphate epimerase